MLDFKKAIQDINSYSKELEDARAKKNKGKDISRKELKELEIGYEYRVKPYADAIGLQDSGEDETHKIKIKYENAVEWFLKVNSTYTLAMAIVFINRLIGRIKYYEENPEQFSTIMNRPHIESALARIQQAMRMFDTSAKILANRRKGKDVLEIKDEYDVQDILHCILKPQFPDITPEEHTPQIGKGEKRIDLVIPSARIVIEIKALFDVGRTLKMVDELKVDIESYHSHSSCSTLIAFIYNPLLRMEDPNRIIADLSGTRTKGNHTFEVIVEIFPK